MMGGDQGSCPTARRSQDAPHQRVIQPQMPVVLRLRNPGSFYRFETRDPEHEASGLAKAAGRPPLSSAVLRGSHHALAFGMRGLWEGTRLCVGVSKSGFSLLFSLAERHQKIISLVTPAPRLPRCPHLCPIALFITGMAEASGSPWNQNSELKTAQTWQRHKPHPVLENNSKEGDCEGKERKNTLWGNQR